MIYLQPEVRSGLGEDTFWTWFHREIGGTFDPPAGSLGPQDIALRYSTLGAPRAGDGPRTIALLWELLPEMKETLGGATWDAKIELTRECARESEYRIVATPLAKKYYADLGPVEVLPIGVDTDLFRPHDGRLFELRAKYGIPRSARVGFWCGTLHPMKGFARLLQYDREHESEDIHWITVWKSKAEAPPGATYVQVPQKQLAELMNCANFVLCSGMLRPFYMVEWEAMACDLPVVITNGRQKDFIPSAHPRDNVFDLGWDRYAVKDRWIMWLRGLGVTW